MTKEQKQHEASFLFFCKTRGTDFCQLVYGTASCLLRCFSGCLTGSLRVFYGFSPSLIRRNPYKMRKILVEYP